MAENVPRRLQRFYRQKGANTNAPQENQSNENYADPTYSSGGFSSESFGEVNKETQESAELNKIPSMDYEDLKITENNLKEIKKFEKKNTDEQVVENEVEKFKKQYNRMPNKEETDKIAESLYNQFKDNPLEEIPAEESSETTPQQGRGTTRREQRRQKPLSTAGQQVGRIPGEDTQDNNVQVQKTPEKVTDIKNLLANEPKKKTTETNEFDLGLGDEEGTDLDDTSLEGDSIDDLGEMALDIEGSNCPNCKKNSDKIIYCPKCGTAFCKSCAKLIEGNEATCPKCGTKAKI